MSSGAEVPKETTVTPIKRGGTRTFWILKLHYLLKTRLAISRAKPRNNKRTLTNIFRGFFFFGLVLGISSTTAFFMSLEFIGSVSNLPHTTTKSPSHFRNAFRTEK